MSRRALLFAALTFLTLLYSGMIHWALYQRALGVSVPLWTWPTVAGGLWYAGSVFGIMAVHELGHVFACWRHAIHFSGPYLLPIGFPVIGTFGAFIRVHSYYPDRTALMHVGLSGPLFGFVATLPALVVGLAWSQVDTVKMGVPMVRFGKPWLLEHVATWQLGPHPSLTLHPLATGAWVGLLFTLLNLVPYRQFDGGHIVRAAFGPRVGFWCSVGAFIGAGFLARHSLTWFAFAVVMALSWQRIDEPLDKAQPSFRWLYVLVAAALFALCWNQIDIRRR